MQIVYKALVFKLNNLPLRIIIYKKKPLTLILIYFIWNGIHKMNAVYNYNDK